MRSRLSLAKTLTVFYHFPCTDGFGAAWAFWVKYRDIPTYCPLSHKEFGAFTDPAHAWYYKTLATVSNHIVFADICPPADVIRLLASTGVQVTILDHHITAKNDFAGINVLGLSNVNAVFDIEHSGAVLAWNYCFPNQVPPLLLQHIEDRDIWNWKLDNTAEYMAMLELADFDFVKWDNFAFVIESDLKDSILAGGKAIVAYEAHKQNTLLSNVHTLTVAGYEIPALTISMWQSNLGNIMAQTAPAAAVYYREPVGWYISLRSDKNNPQALDVSAIAQAYGGGGHKHAAAFRIPTLEALASVTLV
jgi:oligoribonuclease NrnB/cAMP/cGMP phosphodiesterase (DHH superfamily)